MKITNDISDKALFKELGNRVARYRLNRNLTQKALAKEAGVSLLTVTRIENGQSAQAVSLFRILRALRILENVEALIPEPAVSPIQQLQLHGESRKRASSRPDTPGTKEPWSWGDEGGDEK